jgi:hypothetical protein
LTFAYSLAIEVVDAMKKKIKKILLEYKLKETLYIAKGE